MNLVNYNQDNHQINGLVGLGSFAAAFGGLFAIEGGNVRLIASAYRQANRIRRRACLPEDGNDSNSSSRASVVRLVPKRVTSVVARPADDEAQHRTTTFELFSNETSLGEFDIVVVAAPLQHARVGFYVQSAFDSSVLQPMPLGHRGIIDPDRGGSGETGNASSLLDPEGHSPFPPDLDPASTRPYTQVVTTLVSNATLSLLPPGHRPRSIMMTARGKASLHNITAITQLHHRSALAVEEDAGAAKSDGVSLYKVFSDERLPREALVELFGPRHVLEYVKEWPRPHGGATPDYRAGSTSEHFLLYDGGGAGGGSLPSGSARGPSASGGGGGGAIYYPLAMEQSTLACMELSAIGAKATAKLIAQRLGLLTNGHADNDESLDEL
jgi:prenylcysteine oxidase/farnesylcysteine lyase